MEVQFSLIGVDFDANVRYVPASPATHTEPGNYEECEIETLSVNGRDARYLLYSDLIEDLDDKALTAARKAIQEARDERLEARFE